jgi:hypothetical protein
MKRTRLLVWPLVGTLLMLASIAAVAEVGGVAPQAPPGNQSPPTISGTPQEGSTLTANNGTWTGSPTSFEYQWRRCDENGGSCSNIGGATERTYLLRRPDVGNTIRVRVTARNADGSNAATSVPTAVVRAAPAASGCAGAAPIPIASVAPPERLSIDGQSITPSIVGRSSRSITIRVHVACDGKAVQGALVLVEVVPFNQYNSPGEATTGADGWAQVTMSQLSGFPAARQQQLLVAFLRARKPGENVLGGVSTRRLVSFPVDLRR